MKVSGDILEESKAAEEIRLPAVSMGKVSGLMADI